MTNFVYKGSDKDSHSEIVSLGCMLGLQNIRKMSMGEKIAELANDGNKLAVKIANENPKFFDFA